MQLTVDIPDYIAKFLQSQPEEVGRNTLIREFNIPEADARYYMRAWRGRHGQSPVIESGIPEVNLTSYKDLLEINTNLNKRLEKERDKTRLIADACTIAIGKINQNFFVPVGKKVDTEVDLELHALRSDAHVGELVTKAETQGVSEYNFDIYERRVDRWHDKILLFKKQDERNLGLNKLVLVFLGDQATGEAIYQGQAFQIQYAVVDQIYKSVKVEVERILSLATHFHTIEIFCIRGNHGRIGKKGQHDKRTNWDYIFYRALKEALSHQKNIKVFVSESAAMLVQHGDYVFLYKHGDNIRSYVGLPYYGLERDYHRIQVLYDMRVDYECIGHFHQDANIKDSIIINSSMVGGSDLSVNSMTQASRPSQTIFYFHPEEGINRESKLKLADSPVLTKDKNGIYTAYS